MDSYVPALLETLDLDCCFGLFRSRRKLDAVFLLDVVSPVVDATDSKPKRFRNLMRGSQAAKGSDEFIVTDSDCHLLPRRINRLSEQPAEPVNEILIAPGRITHVIQDCVRELVVKGVQ